MKVLIIDDVIINIVLVEEILANQNIDTISAEDGETGLLKAQEENVGLILLDINMPDINGYEVCSRLKSMPKTKDISIIFITSNTDNESLRKGFSVGADDYLTKPLDKFEILAKVKVHLNKFKLFNELNDEIHKRKKIEDELKEANDQYVSQNEELIQYIEQLAQTTQRLENSESKLRAIFEYSVDAIFLLKDNQVVDCSKSALSLFDLKDKSDFENRNQINFSPEYQPDGSLSNEKAEKYTNEALHDGSSQFEWVHINSKGKEFVVDTTYTRIIQDDEKSIFAVLRNITHRKR